MQKYDLTETNNVAMCIGENGIVYRGKAAEKIQECWKAQDKAAWFAEHMEQIMGF